MEWEIGLVKSGRKRIKVGGCLWVTSSQIIVFFFFILIKNI